MTRKATRRRTRSVEEWVAGVRGGDRAVLGQAITLVESDHPEHRAHAQELLVELLPLSGNSIRVGISGVPGAGKSTFIENLGARLTADGKRVAVLAVDPSSTVSRGSILGDKTRMAELANDPRAFVRPSPSGGSLGGVARKTRESILVCEAAGFDVVVVETVGVGQSETTVAGMVDTFLLLMLAGAGDELQGIKRGILELADFIAINKADGENRANAERARTETERALHWIRGADPDGPPPVVAVSALENFGLEELWAKIEERHGAWSASGRLEEHRRGQRLRWMWETVRRELVARLEEDPQVSEIRERLERRVLDGATTPTLAAEEILQSVGRARKES